MEFGVPGSTRGRPKYLVKMTGETGSVNINSLLTITVESVILMEFILVICPATFKENVNIEMRSKK